MTPAHAVTLREVAADLARPTLTDRSIRAVQAAAEAVARRLWTLDYARAERHYWPELENNKWK